MAHGLERLRRRAQTALLGQLYRSAAMAGWVHPRARRAAQAMVIARDVAYGDRRPEHRLDVYRPRGPGPWPAVLYLHGGGFQLLSKDTHWMMAMALVRRGYAVFNASYRLAPRHPYPAGLVDAIAAYRFVLDEGDRYGADPSRVVVAGESAGGNLALALTLASAWPRPEPWAAALRERERPPDACVSMCGLLQASYPPWRDEALPGRFGRFVGVRLREIALAYLGPAGLRSGREHGLADPLAVLEAAAAHGPRAPLPPIFLPVGAADPLAADTRRAEAALRALGAPVQAAYYPGQPHAFHALLWRPVAREAWDDVARFLAGALARPSSAA